MSSYSAFDAHLDNYGDPAPSGSDDQRDFAEEAYNQVILDTGDGEASPESPGRLYPMEIILYHDQGPHVELLFRSSDERKQVILAMERSWLDFHSYRFPED